MTRSRRGWERAWQKVGDRERAQSRVEEGKGWEKKRAREREALMRICNLYSIVQYSVVKYSINETRG